MKREKIEPCTSLNSLPVLRMFVVTVIFVALELKLGVGAAEWKIGEGGSAERREGNGSMRIRKCCPVGNVVNLDGAGPDTDPFTCVSTNRSAGAQEGWSPYLYTRLSSSARHGYALEALAARDYPAFHYHVQPPPCNGSKLSWLTPHSAARGSKRAEIRLERSGLIYTRLSGNHKWNLTEVSKVEMIPIDHICIDGLQQSDSAFTRSQQNQILIFCLGEGKQNPVSKLWFLHVGNVVVVTLFLSVVVVTHALVWRRNNIHGWTVATYSFSFLVFVLLESLGDNIKVFRKLGANEGEEIPSHVSYTTCFTIGVFSHFFSIAKYSWMLTINFDMWSSVVSIKNTFGRQEEKQRFLYFLLFGFGVPAVVVSISLIIEFSFGYFDERVYRPQYGVFRCDVDRSAMLFHEILVNSLLFLAGIVISCITVRFIFQFLNRTNRRRSIGAYSNRRYLLVQMFSKIFVLLAFSWAFEIGGMVWSFVSRKTLGWHVALFDIHNYITSVGFFWFFVCTPEMATKLSQSYKCFADAFSWLERKGFYRRPSVSGVGATSTTAM